MTRGVPIQALISDGGLIENLIYKDKPWIKLPLKIWNEILKLRNMREIGKMLRWCAYDSDFTLNRVDSGLKGWAPKGLTAYCMFYSIGEIKCFQYLKQSHGLDKQDFY